jgi:hypothetical protein
MGALDAFVKNDNVLYVSFNRQVRAGLRLPEQNEWDPGRVSAENAVNPNYSEEINYAALSLDGFGVLAWVDYSITFKDKAVDQRASVFEENPFAFCQRHRLVVGQPVPAGYRAAWDQRDQLAMAKLYPQIDPGVKPAQYAPILLRQGETTGEADFIEVHIYGPLHRAAIERVVGPRPKARSELVLWKSVVAQLKKLGVVVEEV